MEQVPLPPNNQYGNKPPVAASVSGNSQQYNSGNNVMQGTSGSTTKKLVLILIVVAAVIGILAIGSFYFVGRSVMSLFGENNPLLSNEAVASPQVTPAPTINPKLDSDGDDISDLVEKAIGTNSNKMDSDGDSYNDLPELKSGYSPVVPGGAGKLTPEQLQALKDKIKTADEDFYKKTFETVAVDKTPVYPDDYKLKDSEIPIGFYYRVIDDEARQIGLTANPGFLSNEHIGQIMPIISPGIDPSKVKAVYMTSLTKTGKDSEIGYIAIKFNYGSSGDFSQVMKKVTPREGFVYLENGKDILVMIGNNNSDYSVEANSIASKLQNRLDLKRM